MPKTSFRLLAAVAVAVASPAFAQATRTWVSGTGDDVNPCSRTAPCKTFAGAISKTAPGGEINCIDPGGYGAVTITRSITIDCSGTFGSTLNSGTNGFTINDSATATPNTIDVILRGLSINGAGTSSGLNGVRFISGRSLLIENVFIQNQNGGHGVSIQPQGAAEVVIQNVTITDSGSGVSGGGILVQPTGAAGSAAVILRDVRVQNNANNGMQVNTTGATSPAGIVVTVDNSSFSGNAQGVAIVTPPATTTAVVLINDSTIASNSGTGIVANGGTATVRVANSTITGNGTGINPAGGSQIVSFGNNRLIANPASGAPNNGTFSATISPN